MYSISRSVNALMTSQNQPAPASIPPGRSQSGEPLEVLGVAVALDRDRGRGLPELPQVLWYQRDLGHLRDVLGPAGQARLPSGLVEPEAELGGDHHLPPVRLQRLADEFLVDERPVYLRGVEERDAALGRRPDHRDHLVPVSGRRPVALAHAHAAEADSRDLQASRTEPARLHQRITVRGTRRR